MHVFWGFRTILVQTGAPEGPRMAPGGPGGAPEGPRRGPGGALRFLATSKSDFAGFDVFFSFVTDFDGFQARRSRIVPEGAGF